MSASLSPSPIAATTVSIGGLALKMLQSVSNQMLQSPARLGLQNPNSPSLQNVMAPKFSSQTQTQQPNPSLNQLPTPTVSAFILPLLPPLPRAQYLLLQMASLASKLFETSPNRSHWISAFRGSLPSFLSSTPPESSPSSAKEIISQLTTLRTQLFEAVAELQQILDLQDAKQKLSRDIRSKDSTLLTFANKLKESENVLDMLVDDYSDYRRPKRTKSGDDGDDFPRTRVATPLNLSDILSCAHKISYATFAPPEYASGQAPLRGALPPAPQDEQMRASQLFHHEDLDIGLPRKEEPVGRTIESVIETPAAPSVESNTPAKVPATQGLIPPNIVVPSGWKPGMPVELPADLTILPPPGWKPGDPVALPPFDALPVPPRTEGQQLRPIPAPATAKPPETIQVRHVQLDIEDDSSDYSSDGSED